MRYKENTLSFDFKLEGGDLKISSNGDLAIVENTEKLIQDLLKIALTPVGSNPTAPWYGSGLSTASIGSAYDFEFMSTMATNYLRNSVELLQALQKEQSKYQKVTAAEQIAAIKDISIERSPDDPRYFKVTIQVYTRSLTVVTTDFTISPYI